jgi:hypothetical protein
MLRRLVLSVGTVALVVAAPVAAQDFEIGPHLGYVKFKDATGLDAGGMLGLDAVFRISSRIGIGARLDVGRPRTDGKFFPAEMSFSPVLESDTTLLFEVEQPVTLLQYHVQATVETGGALSLFARGGGGGYTITLDPQVAAGRRNVSGLGFSVGGGVRLRTSSGTSIVVEVLDLVFTEFNREELNPVQPRFRPVRYPDVVPPQAPFSGTAHNLYFALAFTFTPGGAQ